MNILPKFQKFNKQKIAIYSVAFGKKVLRSDNDVKVNSHVSGKLDTLIKKAMRRKMPKVYFNQ